MMHGVWEVKGGRKRRESYKETVGGRSWVELQRKDEMNESRWRIADLECGRVEQGPRERQFDFCSSFILCRHLSILQYLQSVKELEYQLRNCLYHPSSRSKSTTRTTRRVSTGTPLSSS